MPLVKHNLKTFVQVPVTVPLEYSTELFPQGISLAVLQEEADELARLTVQELEQLDPLTFEEFVEAIRNHISTHTD